MSSFKPNDGWIRLAPKVLFRPSQELRGVGLHLEVSSTFAAMQAVHMNAEGAPAAAVAQWQVFDKLLKEGRNVVALGPDVEPPLSFLSEGTAVSINGGPGCEPGSSRYPRDLFLLAHGVTLNFGWPVASPYKTNAFLGGPPGRFALVIESEPAQARAWLEYLKPVKRLTMPPTVIAAEDDVAVSEAVREIWGVNDLLTLRIRP